MGNVTKIDNSNIGIVQPIAISDIQGRIEKRNEQIADYQATIAAHNQNINDLTAQNDMDKELIKQAADLNVKDAVDIINPKAEALDVA